VCVTGLESSLGDATGQRYRKLDGRLYVAEVVSHKRERRIVKDEQDEKDICVGADFRSFFAWSDGL
jgi:hypothetical protein